MARIRSWAEKQVFPALTGLIEFKRRKGQVVIAAWPRKRGKKATPNQRRWREWFTQANRLAKIGDPDQLRLAIEYTRNTGLYPRDLLLRAMSRGYVDIVDEDGVPITAKFWELEPMTWQGFMIRPTSNITIGTGAVVDIPWPVPLIQTMPFWNAGAPTLITIPPQIHMMELFAGVSITAVLTGRVILLIQKVGGLNQAIIDINASPSCRAIVATGPLLVAEGETYKVQCLVSVGGTLNAASGLFFGGTILAAT